MDSIEKSLVGLLVALGISGFGVGLAYNVRLKPAESNSKPATQPSSGGWSQPSVESNPQPYGPSDNCYGPDCS